MTDGSTERPASGEAGSVRRVAAIILAAGRSTRMKTHLPKVMHAICGRPMLAYVNDACRGAGISKLCVVVGFGKDLITEAFSKQDGVQFIEQREQHGTGHAVSVCADAFGEFIGDVIVIAGDMALVRSETLRSLLEGHRASGAAASIATTVLDDPTGYGRIIRDGSGAFERIIEHRDCDEEQLDIHEVNPSYYCFDAEALFDALPRIRPDNAKGEFYLTDVLAILGEGGRPVQAAVSVSAEDATGINSRVDLAEVAKLMQRRIQRAWMERGVTVIDPDNTWIDSRVTIGRDTVIKPFSYIEGTARIGRGCSVGPFAYVCDGGVVEDGAQVGPGALRAFDSTASSRGNSGTGCKSRAPVVRRPPVQSGC